MKRPRSNRVGVPQVVSTLSHLREVLLLPTPHTKMYPLQDVLENCQDPTFPQFPMKAILLQSKAKFACSAADDDDSICKAGSHGDAPHNNQQIVSDVLAHLASKSTQQKKAMLFDLNGNDVNVFQEALKGHTVHIFEAHVRNIQMLKTSKCLNNIPDGRFFIDHTTLGSAVQVSCAAPRTGPSGSTFSDFAYAMLGFGYVGFSYDQRQWIGDIDDAEKYEKKSRESRKSHVSDDNLVWMQRSLHEAFVARLGGKKITNDDSVWSRHAAFIPIRDEVNACQDPSLPFVPLGAYKLQSPVNGSRLACSILGQDAVCASIRKQGLWDSSIHGIVRCTQSTNKQDSSPCCSILVRMLDLWGSSMLSTATRCMHLRCSPATCKCSKPPSASTRSPTIVCTSTTPLWEALSEFAIWSRILAATTPSWTVPIVLLPSWVPRRSMRVQSK